MNYTGKVIQIACGCRFLIDYIIIKLLNY